MAMLTDREDLDLSLLRTFLAVVRHGSIGKTASAVAKTQPAVSQQMSRLEKIVGRKLFSRTRNGMQLTDHGELLVAYANRAIDLNEEALARLREEPACGTVRLGVSEETLIAGFTRTLMRFRKTYPDVDLQLTVAGPAKVEFLFTHGELDLILTDPALVVGLPIMEWKSQLAWLASTDFPIDPSKTLPLVLCESTVSWREQILSSLHKAGWGWRVVFESASMDATLAVVESGLGVSVLLRNTVRNTGILEVQHTRLPKLPEVRFGLFQSQAPPTRARTLLEAALSTSFEALSAQRVCRLVEGGPWPSSKDTIRSTNPIHETSAPYL